MNMVKLNNKLTSQVISFTETMQSYQGIEQTSHFYTYHRDNGAEVLDIDFRLKIADSGLTVVVNKSYHKDTFSGGHYSEHTQSEIDINTLEIWLEDNGIYSKQAHGIASRLLNTALCVTLWEMSETEFYIALYTEYKKNPYETDIAVKILLKKLTDFTDCYYVQKIWLEIQKNEEKANSLF